MQTRREIDKRYFKKKPWAKYICYISSRCYKKTNKYYKKGIKSHLTVGDLEILWFRDKAYLLKQPSIDRIDNKKHYTFANCQFIELSENRRKDSLAGRPKKIEKLRSGKDET